MVEQDTEISLPKHDDGGQEKELGKGDGGDQSAAELGTFQPQFLEAQKKIVELTDQYLRAVADADNVRRRAQEDVAKAHKYALEKFSQELLGVKDSLEMALATEKQTLDTLLTGVQMTLRQLSSVFEKCGIAEINPVGEVFDPKYHQAISTQETTDQPNNGVVQVLQKGYCLGDRVLRPALVIVAQAISTD